MCVKFFSFIWNPALSLILYNISQEQDMEILRTSLLGSLGIAFV